MHADGTFCPVQALFTTPIVTVERRTHPDPDSDDRIHLPRSMHR